MTLLRLPTAEVQSTSRNVKRYMRAVHTHRSLTTVLAAAGTEMRLAHLALTGGQLAEARRLLGDSLATKIDETPAPRARGSA